jgi:uncharacterized protein (TIGR00375 family)
LGEKVKEFNCDLHYHGPYSTGVSKNMKLPVLAEQARLKGLDLLASADILNQKWFDHVKENLVEEENGVFKHKDFDTFFVVNTEVQCNRRVHHLIFLPDLAAAETLKEKLKGKGIMDSWGCGRPVFRLSAEDLTEKVLDAQGFIGPAHAFTPYYSVYAHFESLKGLYGRFWEKISFIELGLSADTALADLIPENHRYTFQTNSDAHSPWPHRLGREFNRIEMAKPGFAELKKAMERREGRRVSLNVGLDPREGKYHRTACNACYQRYSFDEAGKLGWRCPQCKGEIKKGVKERIEELALSRQESHPAFRPPYLHIIPLAEIIQSTFQTASVNAKKVQSAWMDFVGRFKDEINVLVDEPIENLAEEDQAIAAKVNAFRQGWVTYIPGGGGRYGEPIICNSREELEAKKKELAQSLERDSPIKQKTLNEF